MRVEVSEVRGCRVGLGAGRGKRVDRICAKNERLTIKVGRGAGLRRCTGVECLWVVRWRLE